MSRVHPLTYVCGAASAAGFFFAAVSTSDFAAHLDRQIHGIHCSFLPGLAAADQSGASGCHATLMSPYSSVFRESIWGGIPVALPGMAVFAFLAFWCLWIATSKRDQEERATGFLFVASLLPLLTSGVMAYLSLAKLDAACKLCIGIYSASLVLSLSSLALWLVSRNKSLDSTYSPPGNHGSTTQAAPSQAPLSWATLGLAFAMGVACVAVSVGAYAAAAPDFSSYVGSCGSIDSTRSDVLIPYGDQKGRPQMLEVMDPLCPSCRAFEERLSKMDAQEEVDRQLLLFPLDESCNWMIDRSIHPGACVVSKAVLCSTEPAPVLQWAFENQKDIIAATEKDKTAAAQLVKARFPALANCVDSAEADAKLNQSLRFAVKNRLQVLTPQVFVEGRRLCGEDTDLGLDFALPRLIELSRTQPQVRKELDSEVDEKEMGQEASSAASSKKAADQAAPKTAREPVEKEEPEEELDKEEPVEEEVEKETEAPAQGDSPNKKPENEATELKSKSISDSAAGEEPPAPAPTKAPSEPLPESE